MNKFATKYHKPKIDSIAALYAGFIVAGLTLHIVDGAIDIQPATMVREHARQLVKRYETALIKHIQGLPKGK